MRGTLIATELGTAACAAAEPGAALLAGAATPGALPLLLGVSTTRMPSLPGAGDLKKSCASGEGQGGAGF